MFMTSKHHGQECALFLLFVICTVHLSTPVHAKVYRKCDLVRKLEEQGVSKSFIPTFVCLSDSESGMNSSKTAKPSSTVTSYGIFQLDNKKWCRDDWSGGECKVRCQELTKDDLRASIACAKVRQANAGFRDWPTFEKKCKLPGKLPSIRECN